MPVTPQRDHILGSIHAPVVLVEYGDFECQHCGRAYIIVKQIQQRFGNRLCFVFRHFPQTQIHAHSQNAAETSEVAAAQGMFWQMHDMLFENQQALNNGYLMEYAIKLELDTTQFLRDMFADIYAERVREDVVSGVSSGVSSTPTFFINNVCHSGAWDLESLLSAITLAE